MKKAILVWTAIMAAGLLALAGCGKKETGQAGEYTNLADKESRKAVVAELEACGVTKDGLLFVEKYSAMDPFQATYFKDRAELKEYLLARPDLYGDKTELAPIIMENGNVME